MPPPAEDHARELERRWIAETGSRHAIRVAARGLVILDGRILLLRLDYPGATAHFPGGAVEFEESLEGGLRRELAEEVELGIADLAYRFVANNRFRRDGGVFHLIEHYFEVTPVASTTRSRETGVTASWHDLDALGDIDLRPHVVRDLLRQSNWREIRYIESE